MAGGMCERADYWIPVNENYFQFIYAKNTNYKFVYFCYLVSK